MLENNYNNSKLKYLNEFIIRKDPREDYKLLKNIGNGTYGAVYKAINRHTDVLVAIKIIKVDIKDDVKVIAQEIHTLRDFNHPNIVKYFGSYLRKNKLWICMELCGAFSMQDIVLNLRRPLDENCIAFVTRETLRGLSYMHSLGKIHRDIKGANILVTEDGYVKIADFGIAAQISETIQKRTSFIGTPYWMAPEVAAVQRTGGYNEKCDIWAVGITTIEYAELQPPMFDLHPMKALRVLSMRNYKAPVLKDKAKWSSRFHVFLKSALNTAEKKRPDAETLLQHEFVAQPDLSVALTRRQLHLARNPAQAPLVTGDDSEEEHSQRPERTPPERIHSMKRSGPSSLLEDARFTIKKAPICEEEREDESEDASRASNTLQSGGDTETDAGPKLPNRINRAESFHAYIDTSPADKTSDEDSKSEDPPTPPPRRHANPPPIPPLPYARRNPLGAQFQTKSILPSEGLIGETRPRKSSMTDLTRPISSEETNIRRLSAIHDGTNSTDATPNSLYPMLPPRNKSSPVLIEEPPETCLINVELQLPEGLNNSLSNPPSSKTPRLGVPVGECFSLIFEGCPLKINATATWTHPLRKAEIVLFGTNDGIYYLCVDDLSERSLMMLFPRPCLWLYVVKNTMVSLSGEQPQIYIHNLLLLLKLKSQSSSIYLEKLGKLRNILPKRFFPTVSVPGSSGCLIVNIARNPSTGAKYLYAALVREILVMEWFEPLNTFMEVKRVPVQSLSEPMVNFDLLIFPERSLPVLCLGVFWNKDLEHYQFHMLDPNTSSVDAADAVALSLPTHNLLPVVKVVQLETKTVLIAFRDRVVITDLLGRVKTSKSGTTELKFDFEIQSIVCLSDSVMAFHRHGLASKTFQGQATQDIADPSGLYRLIGADRNIVVERRAVDPSTNDADIYTLAVLPDSV